MDILDAQRENRSAFIGGGAWVGGLALFVFAWIGRSIATGEQALI